MLCTLFAGGQLRHSEAQLSSQFGKNKVHYKDFAWATLQTSHFRLYFYRGEEQLARNTEKMAERAYQYLAATLQYQFTDPIPLIIYASSDDFQQTEIIDEFLGEGIGGVTESLKGRVMIPFLGSYRDFNHVLVHELTHAFQFAILNDAEGSLSMLAGEASLPLWFIEGMAEYLAEYANPLTTLWLRDAVANDALPASAEKMDDLEDIRAYRFGEALVGYIAEQHGVAMLGKLLRESAKAENADDVIRKAAQTDWKALFEGWRDLVKKTYAVNPPGMRPIKEQAQVLIAHAKDDFALNIIPAVSPDGKSVAFISDRNFYQTIYLASAQTGQIIKPLVEGERRGTYENLRFLNTSIAWSPDSRQIAFNAQAGGENAIYLLDVATGQVRQKLTPPVTSLSFLSWSPDGQQICFTGTKNGQEDLFVITLATQAMVRLTDDLYANRHPAWSPDGAKIAFTTDAGALSDPAQLQFGPAHLALYDMAQKTTVLLTDTAANDFTPVWSPDGSMLAFISDRTGVCNIYLFELASRRIVRVTNVTTGIVGLTEANPALTWAKASGQLLFSGFANKGWDIFARANPAVLYREYLAETGFVAPPEIPESKETAAKTAGKKDWAVALAAEESQKLQDYHARLSPEYILGGGGGNDQEFFVLARLGFSDVLSNHRLRIGFTFTNVLDESDFWVAYSNRAHRLSYGLAAFQFGGEAGTYSMKDAELAVNIQRGAGGAISWPFDKFRRLELGAEVWMVEGELLKTGATTPEDLKDQFFLAPSLAYVADTTLYTAIGPLDGRRARYSLYPAFGNFTYFTAAIDQRWYWRFTKRSTLAGRALALGSFGENARIFNVGGPDVFRGREANDADNDLRGTKVALGNLEFRFPLLPKVDFLRGALFWDLALVWTDGVQPFTAQDARLVRLKDLHAAYGAGLRIPVRSPFGIVNLRFDVAQETDLVSNIGDRQFLFSIGSDF